MDELALARELADIADEIAMRYFNHDPATQIKADGTIVTEADQQIEAALRKRIGEVFPGHAILGEEDGLQGDPEAPTWVIDPIDGTNNFAWGIPIFGTLIALRIGGRTEAGVASAPALGERYEAARGDGARMNGAPIKVSTVSRIEDSRICYASWTWWAASPYAGRWLEILSRCKRSRGFGDFWGHALVARAAAEAMAEPSLSLWDVAALEVIIEEAGGKMTTFDGGPFTQKGTCLTTNGALHDQLIIALSK
jgi:histidinol-phosphatase